VQLLSSDKCRTWAASHGFGISESFGHPLADELGPRLSFFIPSDAGARVALARGLWERTGAESSEALLWITEWGVWPSGEHQPLAEAARRGLGADRPLHESPGHLFGSGEDDAALSILTLSVLVLWDCWLLPAGDLPWVFVSHDEYGVTGTRHGDRGLAAFLRAIEVLDERGNSTSAV
jgi:hypothetical protein